MHAKIWLLLAAAPLLACGAGSPVRTGPTPDGPARTGTLRGTLVVGPACPAESAAEDCAPRPAAGARLRVSSLAGEAVTRVVADARGAYLAELPAGTYRVELEPEGIESSKDLPAEVEIAAGGETRLDVRIDTGIR
jgi:hypothetical protein